VKGKERGEKGGRRNKIFKDKPRREKKGTGEKEGGGRREGR